MRTKTETESTLNTLAGLLYEQEMLDPTFRIASAQVAAGSDEDVVTVRQRSSAFTRREVFVTCFQSDDLVAEERFDGTYPQYCRWVDGRAAELGATEWRMVSHESAE